MKLIRIADTNPTMDFIRQRAAQYEANFWTIFNHTVDQLRSVGYSVEGRNGLYTVTAPGSTKKTTMRAGTLLSAYREHSVN